MASNSSGDNSFTALTAMSAPVMPGPRVNRDDDTSSGEVSSDEASSDEASSDEASSSEASSDEASSGEASSNEPPSAPRRHILAKASAIHDVRNQTAKDATGITKRIVDSTISKDETEDPKIKEHRVLARLHAERQSLNAQEAHGLKAGVTLVPPPPPLEGVIPPPPSGPIGGMVPLSGPVGGLPYRPDGSVQGGLMHPGNPYQFPPYETVAAQQRQQQQEQQQQHLQQQQNNSGGQTVPFSQLLKPLGQESQPRASSPSGPDLDALLKGLELKGSGSDRPDLDAMLKNIGHNTSGSGPNLLALERLSARSSAKKKKRKGRKVSVKDDIMRHPPPTEPIGSFAGMPPQPGPAQTSKPPSSIPALMRWASGPTIKSSTLASSSASTIMPKQIGQSELEYRQVQPLDVDKSLHHVPRIKKSISYQSSTSLTTPGYNDGTEAHSKSSSVKAPLDNNTMKSKYNQRRVEKSTSLLLSRPQSDRILPVDAPQEELVRRTSKLPLPVRRPLHLSEQRTKKSAESFPVGGKQHDLWSNEDAAEMCKMSLGRLAEDGIPQLAELQEALLQQQIEPATKPILRIMEAARQVSTMNPSFRATRDSETAGIQPTPQLRSKSLSQSTTEVFQEPDIPAEASRSEENFAQGTLTNSDAPVPTLDFQLSPGEVDETNFENSISKLLLDLPWSPFSSSKSNDEDPAQFDVCSEHLSAEETAHHTKSGPEKYFAEPKAKQALSSMSQSYDHSHHCLEAQKLREQVEMLQRRIAEFSSVEHDNEGNRAPWPVLHRVHCGNNSMSAATYIDTPILVWNSGRYHFDGRRRIPDEEEWEYSQVSIPFVVYLNYVCCEAMYSHYSKKKRSVKGKTFGSSGNRKDESQQNDDIPSAEPRTEEIHLLSNKLREAVEETCDQHPDIAAYLPMKQIRDGRLRSPYVFHYHLSEKFRTALEQVAEEWTDEFETFLDYLKTQTESREREASELFSEGIVTPQFIPYLFPLGGLLVRRRDEELLVVEQRETIEYSGSNGPESGRWSPVHITVQKIEFDGEFFYTWEKVTLKCEYEDKPHVRIQDLPFYPLLYAEEEDKDFLRKRGEFFFSCRNGRYVVGPPQHDDGLSDVRYMVDVSTYYVVHRNKRIRSGNLHLAPVPKGDDYDEHFILRLPAMIQGFHMQDKKWVRLSVERLKPVDWNEDAFNSLAVDDDTKELVEALVTNKIEADKGTDLVAGKGTGLIMLLHGGPGTGKTLTAESVAEIAKKPLYRVTCGDLGTDAKGVEEYLESVFQFGRIWDCVVLLDEADVFLEQRSLASLERNALVSVFLRGLEYYDGILLLTSNRVGTFDEAFRSRIQLALHYKSLDEAQRLKIWNNFIHRLEVLQEDMDVDDIQAHLSDLARPQMNGRQIRNAVTTARQLAKFRKDRMGSIHLKRAINACKQFDDYLVEVREVVDVGNQTTREEEWAREEGIR